MFKTAAKYDARLSDEREVLSVTLEDAVYQGEHELVLAHFEEVSDEIADYADLSDYEAREGCWRLAEVVDRHGFEVELADDALEELCEVLIGEAYGERFYDADERRIPAWQPTHREPDDELLSTRHEYVCEKIRGAYERLVEHDDEGPMTDTLEEYAEQYGVELPQEVEN
jgi:hypothetical protein